MLTTEDYKQWYEENPEYATNHYVKLKKSGSNVIVDFILNSQTLDEIDYENS